MSNGGNDASLPSASFSKVQIDVILFKDMPHLFYTVFVLHLSDIISRSTS